MEKRFWRVVEFEVPKAQEELAGWLMMQIGANGCEFESAPDGVLVRATFEENVLPGGDTTKVLSAMDEYGLSQCVPSLRVSRLEESDWLAEWKKGFEPFPVGERILVCPAWMKDELDPKLKEGRAVILIEPGLAFGTGFHATTRFCLAAMQDYVIGARKVLDVGAGTGILSVAAAKLNAGCEIVAVEIDPLACKVARENLELNGESSRIELVEGTTEKLGDKYDRYFDLILSNMTYEDNAALLPEYIRLAEPGCHVLFAGVLKEKLELMRAAIAKHGLQIEREEVGDMWAGIAARVNG